MADLLDKALVTADQIDDNSTFYIVVDPSGTPSDNRIHSSEVSKYAFLKALVVEEIVGGTSYSLVAADRGKKKRFTSSSSVSVTVPDNATVAFPIGIEIQLFQGGTGTVTVSGSSGVVINSAGGALSIAGQNQSAVLQKRDTDEWDMIGALQ